MLRLPGYPYVDSKYHYGAAKMNALGVVAHMAEGGATVGFLSRTGSVSTGVSVHFVIEYNGRVVQMLGLEEAGGSIRVSAIRKDNDQNGYGRAVAVSVLGLAGANDPNSCTIQVEMEGFARTGPNAAQRASWAKLVDDLRRWTAVARLKLRGALGHRDFANYKACPGTSAAIWACFTAVGGHGRFGAAPVEVKVDSFPIFEDTYPEWFGQLKPGEWLYDNDRFATSAGNKLLDLESNGKPRPLPILSAPTGKPAILVYEPEAGDANSSSMAMFAKPDAVERIWRAQPAGTGIFTQEQFDAAKAEAARTASAAGIKAGFNAGLDAAAKSVAGIQRR